MESDKLLLLDLCSRRAGCCVPEWQGCCAVLLTAESWWAQRLLYWITRTWALLPPQFTLGFFPFPQAVLQLLIFLLSCSCSYVSWLLVLVFVSQAFTDFHLPSLFYSSVIDSCPVPSYCCIHSQVLHSFPSLLHLSFPYLLPHSLQMLFCFWFHHHPCFQSPSS